MGTPLGIDIPSNQYKPCHSRGLGRLVSSLGDSQAQPLEGMVNHWLHVELEVSMRCEAQGVLKSCKVCNSRAAHSPHPAPQETV